MDSAGSSPDPGRSDTPLGLKPGGFSGAPPSPMPGVRGATRLGAGILGRVHELDPVRYRTTRSQAARDADGADVGAAHDVAGRHVSTPSAPIGAGVLRPLAADGARLRRVVLFDLDAGRELGAQQVDDL